jgi:hypothetical protein
MRGLRAAILPMPCFASDDPAIHTRSSSSHTAKGTGTPTFTSASGARSSLMGLCFPPSLRDSAAIATACRPRRTRSHAPAARGGGVGKPTHSARAAPRAA